MYDDEEDEFQMTEAKPSALKLAKALKALIAADAELELAIKNVPSYTAQYSDEHFYRHEQKAYNEACNAYEDAVTESLRTRE